MLVLTRKQGQAIEIDGVGTVRVLKSSHGAVKLGIDIVPGINVRRSELGKLPKLPKEGSNGNGADTNTATGGSDSGPVAD